MATNKPPKQLTATQLRTKMNTIAATFGILTPSSKFTFGKYKGHTVRSILKKSPDYILWVQANTNHKFAPDVIRSANEALAEKKYEVSDTTTDHMFDYDYGGSFDFIYT